MESFSFVAPLGETLLYLMLDPVCGPTFPWARCLASSSAPSWRREPLVNSSGKRLMALAKCDVICSVHFSWARVALQRSAVRSAKV